MLSDIRYRLRALLRRGSMERELADELQGHVERETQKLIARGVHPDDARRRALAAIGGLERVKEECREARGVSSLETTARDLAYAVRQLRKNPGFAAVVVTSLALGIGANTAIFTLIDAVLLRSLPVAEPERLQFVVRHQPDGTSDGYTYKDFRLFQASNPVFSDVAAYATTRLNVSIDGSLEPTAEGHLVSGSYFSMLGVRAIAGRVIGPDDDRTPNGHPVAMLGYAYWQRRFGRDPSVIGRTIALSGVPFTVVGVAPPEFFGLEVGRAADIFVPVMMQPTVMPASENWLGESIVTAYWLHIVGRLQGDRSPEQASAVLAGLDLIEPIMTKSRSAADPPHRIPERLGLAPAATGLSTLREQFSTPLVVLMLVVGLVLLIACANVASLVLARSAARTPEFSMRLALGAGTWRLIRQLLIENLVLAGIGGVCGLVLARWAASLLVTFISAGRAPIVLDLSPHTRILLFTAAVSMATGVLCGLVPALRARRVDVIAGLRQQRGAGGGHWLRPGRALVIAQVGLCLVLLFGAGVFVRSLRGIDGQDNGFDRDRVLVVRVEPRGSDQRGIPGASQRLDTIYRDLISRVRAIPGVRSASMAHFGPTSEVYYGQASQLPSGEMRRIPTLMIYPGYFETMGIPIRAGRDLQEQDLAADSDQVGIVNEAFVRRIMNGESPLGKRIPDWRGRQRQIIGIVGDSKYASLRTETPPLIYQPFLQTQTGRGQMTLHVRTAPDAAGVSSRVREEVQRIDANMPLFTIETLAAEVDALLSQERLVATLSTLFSLLALLLACVGLYGLMAFNVVGRTSEIGIRMALGAERGRVVGLIMRDALRLVCLGLAVGVPAALIVGRISANQISSLVYGVSTTDPMSMGGAIALLAIVAALAAYFPAARAARVDPMVPLRHE